MNDRPFVKQITDEWLLAIEDSLARVENQRRRMINLKPFDEETPVWISTKKNPNAPLQLLNWKVWMKRYCISLDFIIETLTRVYAKSRHCGPNEIRLGLAINTITGEAARQVIEDEVKRAYPDGENFMSANNSQSEEPLESLEYESSEDLVAKYSSIMQGRQDSFASRKEKNYHRNFRKVNVNIFKR